MPEAQLPVWVLELRQSMLLWLVGPARFLSVESCFPLPPLLSPTDAGLFAHSMLILDSKPLIVLELSI